MTGATAVIARAGIALGLAVAALLATAALAETRFVLGDGSAIEGEVIQATRNTLTVRRAIGGIRQIARSDLQRVEVTSADGTAIRGDFAGWTDGRLAIRSGAELVWVEDDRIVQRERTTAATEPPAPLEQNGPAATAAPPATLTPAPAAAVAPAAGTPTLKVQTAPEVEEGAGEVVFTLELAQALEEPLVVVFSTVDGAALEGQDYLARNGIVTIPAGATSGEVRVPLIENEDAEGDREFHLLVAANPERATVVEEWTSVTIREPGS